MAHEKVFAICENKCKVETLTKEQIEACPDEIIKRIVRTSTGNEPLTSTVAKYKNNTSISTVGYIETRFVTNLAAMFEGCTALTSIPPLDLKNATNTNYMFMNCYNLKSLPELDVANVETAIEMFRECKSLDGIEINLNFEKATDISRIFYEAQTGNIYLNAPQVTNMSQAFLIGSINVSSGGSDANSKLIINAPQVTNLYQAFYGFDVKSIEGLDTSNVTNIELAFDSCRLAEGPELDLSNVTSIERLFYNSSIQRFPYYDLSNVTNACMAFNDCRQLEYVPDLDTSNLENMDRMFSECPKLTELPDLNFENATNINEIISDCTSLTTLRDNPFAPEGSRWQIKNNMDLGDCPLNRDSILKIFKGAQTVTTKTKIIISETTNGQIMDVDRGIITDKGWTLQVGGVM